jgi:hypothetical protein
MLSSRHRVSSSRDRLLSKSRIAYRLFIFILFGELKVIISLWTDLA